MDGDRARQRIDRTNIDRTNIDRTNWVGVHLATGRRSSLRVPEDQAEVIGFADQLVSGSTTGDGSAGLDGIGGGCWTTVVVGVVVVVVKMYLA